MKRYIAGIDPGTTVGLVGIDLRGSLIFYHSAKGLTPSSVERLLLQHGKPIVIATDKAVPPHTVERLSSQLGTLLFTPKGDIPRTEKERIAKLFGIRADEHVRDALAAAYTAYSFFRPKIDAVLRRLREEEFLEGLVEKVLKGQQLLHTLTTELEAGAPPKKGTAKRERKRDEREVVELRRKIGELNEEIKRLRRECRQRKVVRIRSDEEELLKMRRLLEDKERFLRSCEREVSRLRDELIKLKELISRIEGALNAGKIIKRGGEGEPLWKDYVAVPGEFDIKDLVERYREERLKEILAARRTT